MTNATFTTYYFHSKRPAGRNSLDARQIKILIAFIILPLLFPCNSSAQKQLIDSLQKVIAIHTHDTMEANTLNRLATEFSRKDIATAKLYLHREVKLSKELNFKTGLGNAYSQLTTACSKTGTMDSARYYLDKLKQLAEGNAAITASYHFTAGLFYKNLGNFREALPHMLEALKGFTAAHANLPAAGQLLNIGNTYSDLGEYTQAMNYHLKALTAFEELGNKRGQSFCHQSIGNDFVKLGQTQQALPYLQKSLALKEELKDTRSIASAWSGLGDLYKRTKEYNKALFYFAKALTAAQGLKLTSEEAGMCFNIGLVYSEKKDFDNARTYFAKTKTLAHQLGDSTLSKAVDAELIGIQTAISRQHQSEQNLLNSLSTSLEMGRKLTEVSGYQHLVDFYAANKKYDKAFFYLEKLRQVQDSLQGTQVQLQINRLEAQFKNETKEKEIALLKKDQLLNTVELKRQKAIEYAIVAFAALFGVIGFLVINRYRIVQRSKRYVEIERMRNNIARDLHDDIGSTLSSINIISKVALQNQREETTRINFQKIEDHSRNMMDTMSDIVWSINPVNDTLDKTVIRMKEFAVEILEPKNINYHFHESGKLVHAMTNVNLRKNIFLIFKEAVNNAAKYSNCSEIEIDLRLLNGKLELTIGDNGTGFDKQTVKRGNGLVNMQERAQAMGGTLQIETEPGKGTKVSLAVTIT